MPHDYNAVAMTPNRITTAHFDITETVCLEDAWGVQRDQDQIGPAAAQNNAAPTQFAMNVRRWKSGAITARPAQDETYQLSEKPPDDFSTSDYIMSASSANPDTLLLTVPMTEHKMFAAPTMPGIVPASGVLSSGDTFLKKKVAAGDDWTAGLLVAPGVAIPDYAVLSAPAVTLPASPPPSGSYSPASPSRANVPLAVTGMSSLSARADQGWYIRWFLPGTPMMGPDYILGLAFGQYVLMICGNGMAQLTEWIQTGASPIARHRFSFRYCKPSEVGGTHQTLTIYPLLGPNGERFIHFLGSNMEAATGAQGVFVAPNRHRNSSYEELYQVDDTLRGTDADQAPGHVTKAGPCYVVERQDHLPSWQLSKLFFRRYGFLTDQPVTLPPFVSALPLKMDVIAGIPAGAAYQLSALIANAATNARDSDIAFTSAVKSGTTSSTPPNYLYSTFYFFGDGRDTAALWGYKLYRDAVTASVAPGAFTTDVVTVQTDGGSLTPQSESGHLTIQDPADARPRLRKRGELSCRLTTTYTPPGEGATPVDVTLFRGYAIRPQAVRHGRYDAAAARLGAFTTGIKAGGLHTGAALAYPSPEWREYDVLLTGMWHRLSNQEKTSRIARTLRFYSRDTTAAPDPFTGQIPPWKVTDAIRDLLRCAGFPDTQINIADSPIRLFPAIGYTDDQRLDIYADFLSRIVSLARNYLGAYLIFDANASTEGQWILLFGIGTATTPIYHFQTWAASDTAPPHIPAGYPANTSFTIGPSGSYVIPPECNHLMVATAAPFNTVGGIRFEKHYYNFKSYKVPGSTVDPDPESAHYIGRERLYICIDPTLCFTNTTAGINATWAVVRYTGRRLLDVAGRARIIQPLKAPLAIIHDAVTTKYRPLRLGDPVTFNGGADLWYIRSANIRYDCGRFQTADYELEQLVPL